MIAGMKQWLAMILCAIALAVGPAGTARGADEEEKKPDARVEGFVKPAPAGSEDPSRAIESVQVAVKSNSTAMAWIVLMAIAVMCVGAMFKNAKRTHLD